MTQGEEGSGYNVLALCPSTASYSRMNKPPYAMLCRASDIGRKDTKRLLDIAVIMPNDLFLSLFKP